MTYSYNGRLFINRKKRTIYIENEFQKHYAKWKEPAIKGCSHSYLPFEQAELMESGKNRACSCWDGGCGGTEQKNPGILLGMIKLFYILNGVAITWVYTFVKTKNEFYLMKLKNKKYFVISKVWKFHAKMVEFSKKIQ